MNYFIQLLLSLAFVLNEQWIAVQRQKGALLDIAAAVTVLYEQPLIRNGFSCQVVIELERSSRLSFGHKLSFTVNHGQTILPAFGVIFNKASVHALSIVRNDVQVQSHNRKFTADLKKTKDSILPHVDSLWSNSSLHTHTHLAIHMLERLQQELVVTQVNACFQ